MHQPKTRAGSIFQFLIIFACVYLLTQMSLQYFFPERYGQTAPISGVILQVVDGTVKGGHHPILSVQNKTQTGITLADRCPMPPVDVWSVGPDGTRTPLTTEQTALPCSALTTIAAGDTVQIDLAPWKYSLFNGFGMYEVELPLPEGIAVGVLNKEAQYREGAIARFSIYEPGMMTQLFRTFISKPLLNLLIFIASVTPGYNLGVAIILLTLLVKLVLFVPTQHAMEGQRKMQAIQPKMDALRAKHKNDPQKMQEETMKLWKQHGVNPMQSCLPMLVQFPFLIGLFFVIRDGSILELSTHLLYGPHQDLAWSFGTNFLGMDLTVPNVMVMPLLLVVMQFAQMKLSFAINEKKKEAANKGKKKETMSQQEVQQRVMLYGLPLMIGFFAIKFPAAVSLYWAVSTVFAAAQQLYVNRKV